MNFPPNRVQPEQIEDEASHHRLAPPEYQTPEYRAQVLETIRAGRITYAPGWNKRPDHVEAPSIEDEEGPGMFIWAALAIWSVLMASLGWFVRSLL